jgi:ferric-dicitrate binding protein FerR (iron transport regulator)
MSLFGKKKEATTDSEIMLEALTWAKKRNDRKRGIRRRNAASGWKRFVDTRTFIVVGVLLVLVIADGVRRENTEFQATLSTFQGQVTVQDSDAANPTAAVLGEKLVDGNVVSTGDNASANLTFPDGSVLLVQPNSIMAIKLLEYNRGAAWRARAFYLKVGTVLAHVSPHFGHQSELKVYTPSSVAAVRGTIFSVTQDRVLDDTVVACAEGEVRVHGFSGDYVADVTAKTTCDVRRGAPPNRPGWMDPQQSAVLGDTILWQPPPNASKLQVFEYGVNQFLNAPLNILGIGKCGWALGAVDSARRSAAMEALKKLGQQLEGNGEYPTYLNPGTLAELNMDPAARKQILDQLYGNAIDRYIPESGRDYLIYARARDKDRTAFKLTTHGLEFCTKEESDALNQF